MLQMGKFKGVESKTSEALQSEWKIHDGCPPLLFMPVSEQFRA